MKKITVAQYIKESFGAPCSGNHKMILTKEIKYKLDQYDKMRDDDWHESVRNDTYFNYIPHSWGHFEIQRNCIKFVYTYYSCYIGTITGGPYTKSWTVLTF